MGEHISLALPTGSLQHQSPPAAVGLDEPIYTTLTHQLKASLNIHIKSGPRETFAPVVPILEISPGFHSDVQVAPSGKAAWQCIARTQSTLPKGSTKEPGTLSWSPRN